MKFDPSRVRVNGPLAGHAIAFGDQLLLAGYPPERAVRHVQLLAQLSRWMETRSVGEAELCEERLGEFLQARRAAGYWGTPSVRWLAKVLGLIPGLEVTPAPRPAATAAELLVERYCQHLRQERGLARSTIRGYVNHASRFVSRFEDGDGEVDFSGVTAAAVICFVVDQRRCSRSLGSAAKAVTVVRSLLRFLSLEGLVPAGLADAVPAVSVCKGFLPRALNPETVRALLASCDRSTLVGRRDYAVLCLLIRLGLRSGEVARLALDDLDWHRGELVVRGKGSRQERLPMPVDVGEALVAYLDVRPVVECRAVFMAAQAPVRAMTSSAVTQTVASACKRAGLVPVGAHRLRHSAATTMLHAGAPLSEVGQVLRQTALSTTAVYAKVDRVALGGLVRPWPGVVA